MYYCHVTTLPNEAMKSPLQVDCKIISGPLTMDLF